MDYIAVFVAAAAGYAFGAAWYMALAKPWMAAAGRTEAEVKASASPLPYIVAFAGAVLCAGMLRHVFAVSGVTGAGAGLVAGLFIASPWVITTHAFGDRKPALWLIDAGHVTGACAMIGLVLGLFG